MSEIVIDANIAAAALFELQYSVQATEALASAERIMAPDLIVHEFSSAAWKLVIAGRIELLFATEAVLALESLVTDLVEGRALATEAIRIASELRHSVYDCFYVALAKTRNAKLVTADAKLVNALTKSTQACQIQFVKV